MMLQAVITISTIAIPISLHAKNQNETVRIRVTQKNKSTLKKIANNYEKASKNIASAAQGISHSDIKEALKTYSEQYQQAAQHTNKQIRKNKALVLHEPQEQKTQENGKKQRTDSDDEEFQLNDSQKAQLLQAARHLGRAAQAFNELAENRSQKDAKILKGISDRLEEEAQQLREIQEKGAALGVMAVTAIISAIAGSVSAAASAGTATATAVSVATS